MLLGYSRIPYAAARDGYFFKAFAELHPTKGFPHISLLVLGVIYARYNNEPHVVHMFAGLAAAAAGLLVAMALKLALPLRRRPMAIAIAVIVFVAVAVFHLPLVPTMLVIAPLSIFITIKAGA